MKIAISNRTFHNKNYNWVEQGQSWLALIDLKCNIALSIKLCQGCEALVLPLTRLYESAIVFPGVSILVHTGLSMYYS